MGFEDTYSQMSIKKYKFRIQWMNCSTPKQAGWKANEHTRWSQLTEED